MDIMSHRMGLLRLFYFYLQVIEKNSDKVLLKLDINLIKGSSFFRNEQIKMVIEKTSLKT